MKRVKFDFWQSFKWPKKKSKIVEDAQTWTVLLEQSYFVHQKSMFQWSYSSMTHGIKLCDPAEKRRVEIGMEVVVPHSQAQSVRPFPPLISALPAALKVTPTYLLWMEWAGRIFPHSVLAGSTHNSLFALSVRILALWHFYNQILSHVLYFIPVSRRVFYSFIRHLLFLQRLLHAINGLLTMSLTFQ